MSRQLWGVVVMFASADAPMAAPSTFDLHAFSNQAIAVDISRFNTRNQLPPGRYRVDIVVNGGHKGRHDVEFMSPGDDAPGQPCVDPVQLRLLGIVPQLPAQIAAEVLCADLAAWVPMASSTFDANTLEWSMSYSTAVPQANPTGLCRPA